MCAHQAWKEAEVDGIYGNLVAHITREMLSDDYDQSEMLADVYLTSSEAQQDALDRAFTCLCGWSLKTLMTRCAEEGPQDTATPE